MDALTLEAARLPRDMDDAWAAIYGAAWKAAKAEDRKDAMATAAAEGSRGDKAHAANILWLRTPLGRAWKSLHRMRVAVADEARQQEAVTCSRTGAVVARRASVTVGSTTVAIEALSDAEAEFLGV